MLGFVQNWPSVGTNENLFASVEIDNGSLRDFVFGIRRIVGLGRGLRLLMSGCLRLIVHQRFCLDHFDAGCRDKFRSCGLIYWRPLVLFILF